MPYFRVFGKPSVISVTKVGYRFYSVIKMSVLDRFRLDKIWSVSVRLSVNRLFEYITKFLTPNSDHWYWYVVGMAPCENPIGDCQICRRLGRKQCNTLVPKVTLVE